MTNYPIVEVTWEDTTHLEGWWNESELKDTINDPPKNYYYKTVGYLIHKDRKCVILVSSTREESGRTYKYGDIFRFPIKQVVKMEILRDY